VVFSVRSYRCVGKKRSQSNLTCNYSACFCVYLKGVKENEKHKTVNNTNVKEYEEINRHIAVAYRGGGLVCSTSPPPEIPKALQNRAKLNPFVKTVKNC